MMPRNLIGICISVFLLLSCEQQTEPETAAADVLTPLTCAEVSNTQPGRITALQERLEDEQDRTVMVIAHRAVWQNAPENSLCAIAESIALGVDMIEIDVLQTRDGELILMHDDTLDRTTNGTGRVMDVDFEYITSLNLRNRAGGPEEALTDQKVPTLEEALQLAKDNVLINLDMKADVYEEAQELLEALDMEEQVIVKMAATPDDPRLADPSFVGDAYFMPIIREDFGLPLSALAPGYDAYLPEAIELVYQSDGYLQEGAESVVASGARLWVNTLSPTLAAGHTDALAVEDPDAHWGYLVDSGVTMIQTDEPARLLAFLQEKGLHE